MCSCHNIHIKNCAKVKLFTILKNQINFPFFLSKYFILRFTSFT